MTFSHTLVHILDFIFGSQFDPWQCNPSLLGNIHFFLISNAKIRLCNGHRLYVIIEFLKGSLLQNCPLNREERCDVIFWGQQVSSVLIQIARWEVVIYLIRRNRVFSVWIPIINRIRFGHHCIYISTMIH